MEDIVKLFGIQMFIDIVKIFFIQIFTYKLSIKFINIRKISTLKKIVIQILILFFAVMLEEIKICFGFFNYLLYMLVFISLLHAFSTRSEIIYSIVISLISLSLNYLLFIISIIISYIIDSITKINIDNFGIIIIISIYVIISIFFLRRKKIEGGIVFCKKILKMISLIYYWSI